jgi:hypothetical protein
MAKSVHPSWLRLRTLAGKLERNLLTPTEVREISGILRRLADGESIVEVLGVKRKANRPSKATTQYYVEAVWGLTHASYDGSHGMSVKNAIREVAAGRHVAVNTVRAALYSPEGKALREALEEALKDPLAAKDG